MSNRLSSCIEALMTKLSLWKVNRTRKFCRIIITIPIITNKHTPLLCLGRSDWSQNLTKHPYQLINWCYLVQGKLKLKTDNEHEFFFCSYVTFKETFLFSGYGSQNSYIRPMSLIFVGHPWQLNQTKVCKCAFVVNCEQSMPSMQVGQCQGRFCRIFPHVWI